MAAWLTPGQHGQEEVGLIPGSPSEGLDQSHLQFSDSTLLPTVRNSGIPVFCRMYSVCANKLTKVYVWSRDQAN